MEKVRPYLEDRNGIIYEFKRLTRKQDSELMKIIKKNEDKEDLEGIEEAVKYMFLQSHPTKTIEDFEDIMDYTHDEYGNKDYVDLLGAIIEDSFQSPGGKKHPYLAQRDKAQEK